MAAGRRVVGRESPLEHELARQIAFARTVPTPEREFRFAPPRRWRFDFAWPAPHVALEIQGGTWTYGRHSRGKGQELDAEKLSAAAIAGWRVLIVTERHVNSGEALVWIERALGVAHNTSPLERLAEALKRARRRLR